MRALHIRIQSHVKSAAYKYYGNEKKISAFIPKKADLTLSSILSESPSSRNFIPIYLFKNLIINN